MLSRLLLKQPRLPAAPPARFTLRSVHRALISARLDSALRRCAIVDTVRARRQFSSAPPPQPPPQQQQDQRRKQRWQESEESKAERLRHEHLQRKKRRSAAIFLSAIAIGFAGLAYASVPLYRLFCQATGYGGTVKRGHGLNPEALRDASKPATARPVLISFTADTSSGMPWKFEPLQLEVKTHVGEPVLAFYQAENTSDQAITGVATYNVNPMKAGIYFNKVQCFCFDEQRLRPHETVEMPVFFYVDKEFDRDPRMSDVNEITLSYTFFPADEYEGELPMPSTKT